MSGRVRLFSTSFPLRKVQYSCIMCGVCCRTYLVYRDMSLSVRETDKLTSIIENRFMTDYSTFASRHGINLDLHENGTATLNFRGACPFLSRNLCTIHEKKPLDCDLFPFTISPNPDSAFEWQNVPPILVDMIRCPGYGVGEVINEAYVQKIVSTAESILGIDLVERLNEIAMDEGAARMSSIGAEPITLSTEQKFVSQVIKYIDSTEANAYPLSVALRAMAQTIPTIKNFFARLREAVEPGYDPNIRKKASDTIETFFWEYLAELFEMISKGDPVQINTNEQDVFEDPFYGKIKIKQDAIREIVNGVFMSPRAKDILIDYLIEFSGRSRGFLPHLGIDIDLSILAVLSREVEVRAAAYALFEMKSRIDEKIMSKAISVTDMLAGEITLRGLRLIDPDFISWKEDVPWITRYKPTGGGVFLISKDFRDIIAESQGGK
ncbi:MAG: YkgJ family cysteine cluster protein [Candidatus Korarchaeota archaeon]